MMPRCADCPFQSPCPMGCALQVTIPIPPQDEDYDLIRLGDPDWEDECPEPGEGRYDFPDMDDPYWDADFPDYPDED